MTEKFFHPLVVGSVPVYLGAPNVDEFAPGERCYIDTSDFGDPEELAAFLRDMGDDAYAEYLAWKEKRFRPRFQRLLEDQRRHPLVRLCERVRDFSPRTGLAS